MKKKELLQRIEILELKLGELRYLRKRDVAKIEWLNNKASELLAKQW